MTALQWFIFFLVIQVIHGLGTWKLYEKAGRKSWEAFIPIYNAIVLMKIINRPTWWTALLFIPVINIIMFIVTWVETLRSFGKNKEKDTILGVVTLGFYIYYVNYFEEVTYKRDRSLTATTKAGDTIASALYAIVVATLVHTYLMQPFTIPTSSLEKSLLIGDYLFVSKFHYGARTPNTAVALPMVHDSIPFTGIKSYSSWPQLPSFRLPGAQEIKHGDIVVFNWPVDTVYQFFDKSKRHADKPKDKRSNYVKRCVGLPGDNLSIKNGDVYINNKQQTYNDRTRLQYNYVVRTKTQLTSQFLTNYAIGNDGILPVYVINKIYWDDLKFRSYLLKNKNDKKVYLTEINRPDRENVEVAGFFNQEVEEVLVGNLKLKQLANTYIITIPEDMIATIKRNSEIISIERTKHNFDYLRDPLRIKKQYDIFPHNQKWSQDNLGPIYIPEANKTVALNKETLPFYRRLITVYEGNKLEEKGGKIYINDREAVNYTFKQDYYWMMGDNRHNSEDSRYWGFVPFDHVVGKPVFIWWSIDQNIPWGKAFDKIRWNRLFTTVSGDGEPVSYFKYFLVFMAVWFGYDWYRNKKKKNA